MEERTSNPLHHVAATHSAEGGGSHLFEISKISLYLDKKPYLFLSVSMFNKPETGVADVKVALLAEVLDLLY